jgi:hypothetical protein
MTLTAEAVEKFIDANKVVRSPPDVIRWRSVSTDFVRWRGVTEVDGMGRGSVMLLVNRALPRTWNIHLYLHDEPVRMWHFKTLVNHRNLGCGDAFPARVRGPHEHVWTPDCGIRCALPLEGTEAYGLRDCVDAFCDRLGIDLQPTNVEPGAGEQLVIEAEEAEE